MKGSHPCKSPLILGFRFKHLDTDDTEGSNKGSPGVAEFYEVYAGIESKTPRPRRGRTKPAPATSGEGRQKKLFFTKRTQI